VPAHQTTSFIAAFDVEIDSGTYKSIATLSYLERLSNIKMSDIRLTTTGPESWFKAELQHDFLEHHAALLAKRHLDDNARNRGHKLRRPGVDHGS
jgi:hypothetical protein